VHPYTFRNENQFLPTDLRSSSAEGDYGDSFAEYAAFLAAGVDGIFTDNIDTAVTARALAHAERG
jgi:glycerophosphoryl diester phosphodiesterase